MANMDSTERQVKDLLKSLRQEQIDPSPYLKTRVLARLREESTQPVSVFGWGFVRKLSLAGAALGIVAGLGIWYSTSQKTSYQAVANQPVAVRLDVKDLGGKAIAKAEVELPTGVQFYSKRFPKINEQAKLELSFEDNGKLSMPSALPIVIQADGIGTKSVRVKFLNEQNHVVAERILKIKFTNKGGVV